MPSVVLSLENLNNLKANYRLGAVCKLHSFFQYIFRERKAHKTSSHLLLHFTESKDYYAKNI